MVPLLQGIVTVDVEQPYLNLCSVVVCCIDGKMIIIYVH